MHMLGRVVGIVAEGRFQCKPWPACQMLYRKYISSEIKLILFHLMKSVSSSYLKYSICLNLPFLFTKLTVVRDDDMTTVPLAIAVA